MSLADKKLTYTKRWTNADDFPTYEAREERVRSDMQLLYDEAAAALNNLIDYLAASVIPFTPTEAIQASDIQAAIEAVQAQIASAVTGTIPDRSLDGVKLKLKAVGTSELDDDAVTGGQIADDAVDTEHIAPGAVTSTELADDAVTDEKIAPGALPNKADLDGEILNRAQRRLRYYSPSVTSGYIFALADAESVLFLDNATSGAVTIPANSSAAIKVGAEIVVVCSGESVVFTPATGVELLVLGKSSPVASLTISKKNTAVRFIKLALNQWTAIVSGVLAGDVGTDDLADDSVTSAKIAPGAVGTTEIANSAVTYAKTSGLQKEITTATGTLLASGWTLVSGVLTNSINVTGMTSNSEYEAAPNNSTGWEAAADAMLYPPTPGNGVLTFTCKDLPTADIPVTVHFWEA